MRIDIVGSSLPNIQRELNSLHTSINSTISSLRERSDALSNVPGGTGRISYGDQCTNGLSSAISGIKAREQVEVRKLEAVEETSTDVRAFISHAREVDAEVSRTVRENQDEFFKDNPHLAPKKPEEKSWWQEQIDKLKENLKDFGKWIAEAYQKVKEWVKAHPIIVGTVMILVAAVVIVFTGGYAALGAAAVVSAIASTFAALTAIAVGVGAIGGLIYKLMGKDFTDGFKGGYKLAADLIFDYAMGRLFYASLRKLRVRRNWKRHMLNGKMKKAEKVGKPLTRLEKKQAVKMKKADHHIFTNKAEKSGITDYFDQTIKEHFGLNINGGVDINGLPPKKSKFSFFKRKPGKGKFDNWNVVKDMPYHSSNHSYHGNKDFFDPMSYKGYHNMMKQNLNNWVTQTQGMSQPARQKVFLQGMKNMRRKLYNNPDMLYNYYWDSPHLEAWNFLDNFFMMP